MLRDKKVYGIIGAAGFGKRMAAPLPKQFLKIGGKTILETTVKKFENLSIIDQIIIVTAGDYQDLCCQFFHEQINASKIHVICGGKERQDSIYQAVRYLQEQGAEEDAVVLIHDGVRPYASGDLIRRVAERVVSDGAAIAAVPPKDTIRHEEEGTLDRSRLWCVQTPQGFQFSILRDAFEKAFQDGFYGTDDAGLVERIGQRVSIVEGENTNIKITTPEDLTVENRIGTGFDVHRLTENRKLILGGVEIPFEKGLLGHSDADVLLHALMDAMLGAAALGDIGKLFPDQDDSYKDISSLLLLERTGRAVAEAGYSLGNLDATIICQRPKLAGYIDQMRENIARVLGVPIEQVSVKATTTEKLGFTGRGEGIAAEAVCLLTR